MMYSIGAQRFYIGAHGIRFDIFSSLSIGALGLLYYVIGAEGFLYCIRIAHGIGTHGLLITRQLICACCLLCGCVQVQGQNVVTSELLDPKTADLRLFFCVCAQAWGQSDRDQCRPIPYLEFCFGLCEGQGGRNYT